MKIKKNKIIEKLVKTACKEGYLQEFVNKVSAITGQPIPLNVQMSIDNLKEQYGEEKNT